ncbi:MAG TPA: hypothetical protein VFW87_23310 [Pirellulales bacterium]|nr:hypothetical protein [Pirellulales bacterium]
MVRHRFTLAGLLLWITLIALILAFVVPLWRYRQRALGLGDRVSAIAASADGLTAAALTWDGTVFIWDIERGALKTTIKTGGGLESSFALSANGRLAAVARYNRSKFGVNPYEIEIWDIPGRKRVQTLPAPSATGQLAFSPTEDLLLSLHSNHSLTLHMLDGSVTPQRGIGGVYFAAFSPDGAILALDTPQGVRLYDTEALTPREEIPQHGASADVFAFGPKGRSLAMLEETFAPGKGNRRLRTWNLAGGSSRQIAVEPIKASRGATVTYLPGGQAIAVPEEEGLSVFDARSLEPLDRGKKYAMVAAGLCGQGFVVADERTVDLYDAATLQKIQPLLSPNSEPNPILPFVGLGIWFVVFFKRRMGAQMRVCPKCGGRFMPARKNDASTECPTCLEQARFETLTEDQAAREQRAQTRKNWKNLLMLDVLLATAAGMFWRGRFSFAPTFVAVAVGVPALVFLAVRVLRKWVICLPSSLPAEIAVAERAAGSPGQVRHVGKVLVWSAEGTALADELEPQLEATRQRLAAVTGRLVSPSPRLRVFFFADGGGVVRYLQELGFRLEDPAVRRGFYISAPASRLFVGERDARLQEADPCFTLRWLIARHLIEQTGVAVSCAWLIDGLAGMIAYELSEHERASLNRRALAGIATGRTVSPGEWFAGAPVGKRRRLSGDVNLETYAWFRQFQTQSHSLMEFLCGQGATPERRAAFQRLFHDPELQTRPGETFEQHFGCPIDELFAQWRAWVEQQGVGEHHPPPPHVAEYLAEEPLARILAADTRRRDRIEAIREWGERGYVFGAEQVVALLRGDDEELRAEALYALDCVSGLSLGTTAKSWEAWTKQQRPEHEISK